MPGGLLSSAGQRACQRGQCCGKFDSGHAVLSKKVGQREKLDDPLGVLGVLAERGVSDVAVLRVPRTYCWEAEF